MQAWAELTLRRLGCLQPGSTCSFRQSTGCTHHESCGLLKWCDDVNECQPCARWDAGDLSSSVTASPPLSCTGPAFKPDPCWLLRSRGCPCSDHGCFRAVDCGASHLCESSGLVANRQSRHLQDRVAIVTSLCHEAGIEPQDDSYMRNVHFLKFLLRSLDRVQTRLPIYTMVCGRRDNWIEVHAPALPLISFTESCGLRHRQDCPIWVQGF